MTNVGVRRFSFVFLSLFLFACQNFYRSVSLPAVSLEEKQSSIRENMVMQKYFILRQGDTGYAMTGIEVDQQAQVITCKLSALPAEHQLYTTPGRKRDTKRYHRSQPEKAVVTEVHLFMTPGMAVDTTTTARIPLSQLQKIEVIEHDKGRTTTSYVLGGLGITLGVAAVAVVIVALTKSSCPFVSVYDGEQYQVQAELFGGAIYPSLEREDFVPLRIRPVNGAYTLRITNELQEKQFTNFARLMVVRHNKGEEVLPDGSGQLHLIGQLLPPARALLNEHTDITALVGQRDGRSCLFNEPTTDHLNTVELRFQRPVKSTSAQLVLELKNSYWFDFLYGEFTRSFGSYYPQWVKQQKKTPVAELEKWSQEQHIPMNVSLRTPNGWKTVSQLKTVGPLTSRRILVPLDLSESNEKEITLRLSTGFLFWELDMAGIDYSGGPIVRPIILDPQTARDEKEQDVRAALLKDDGHYLDQPQPGMAATLHYPCPVPDDGKETTVILWTKGYYEHVRNYSGKPRVSFLRNFRQPGAFPAFSQQQYQQVLTAQAAKQ